MEFVAMTERSDMWRKIEAIRYMKGWTQDGLAARMSYSKVYVRDVMLGMRKSKTVQKKLANVLGFSSWEELEEADVGVMMPRSHEQRRSQIHERHF